MKKDLVNTQLTDEEKAFKTMYASNEVVRPDLRRVKLHKVDRAMSYYFEGEKVVLDKPELELTIIAIMGKYELKEFNADKKLKYHYTTTEFPYGKRDSGIAILQYKKNIVDGVEEKETIVHGKTTALDFKQWGEDYDEERRVAGQKGFIPFSKYFGSDLGTAFKALIILYGVDKDGVLHRVELTSTSQKSLWAAQKKYPMGIPFYAPTTIKFETEPTVTPKGDEYYVPILEVGKAYETKERVEHMKRAMAYIEVVSAMRSKYKDQDANGEPNQPAVQASGSAVTMSQSAPTQIAEPIAATKEIDINEII